VDLIANALVLLGACFLVVAYFPTRTLVSRLPPGRLRRLWTVLQVLDVAFIAGYLGYVAFHGSGFRHLDDLIVPVVFFLGACFVLLVNTLSLRTAHDVRRMAILEQESIVDPLMGIYNRRYLERKLAEEVARARRYDLPLSVLLVDIDHFKLINDTLGHLAGDLVLEHLGKWIGSAVRGTDVVARYGGEEILVIAPNTPAPDAAVLAERVRRTVEHSSVPIPGAPPGQGTVRITVSIGVADLGGMAGEARLLMDAVDAAMYRAKSGGRNRISVTESPAPEA